MAELFEKLPCGREIHQGRLASVIVGGGKRRLFIIGNYVKQCILKPYHDWAMTVLRRLPNDGTFDQTAPLKYVVGGTDVTSYDLSSATDRFPSSLLFHRMVAMFGEEVASATVVACLSSSRFDIGPPAGSICCRSASGVLPLLEPFRTHPSPCGVVGGIKG